MSVLIRKKVVIAINGPSVIEHTVSLYCQIFHCCFDNLLHYCVVYSEHFSFFFLVLFSFLLQNALENIDDFNQYTVITKIENAYDYPMKLPAVTLCLAGLYPNLATNATLAESLFNCTIAGNLCDKNDFYSFETRPSFSPQFSLTCYVLNGGRNSTGHSREIKSTRNTGSNSGVELIFFLPKKHIFFYLYMRFLNNDLYCRNDNILRLLRKISFL